MTSASSDQPASAASSGPTSSGPTAPAVPGSPAPAVPGSDAATVGSRPTDRLGRPLHDLRISVTDRCNFRCVYCMPREVFGRDYAFLPRAEILTFEEIARLGRIFVALGVRKLRLTGGEPLVRRDLPALVRLLAGIEGGRGHRPDDERGPALGGRARPARSRAEARHREPRLARRGSLPGHERGGVPGLARTGPIAAAQAVGLTPVKVNTVVKRGVNEGSVLPLARYARDHGLILRLIEYMDVGTSNGWHLADVVPASELLASIDAELPIEAVPPAYPGEVASRFRYRDGRGEVGVIASVSQPFCGACTRARLSAEGQLYTCLFATVGHDLRAVLRGGASDAAILSDLTALWHGRSDRYSELRSAETTGLPRVEMFAIGG